MNWYKTATLSGAALDMLAANGFVPKDEAIFGDYELYLFEATPKVKSVLAQYGLPEYQIGIQRSDTDFTDLAQQEQSNPPESSDLPIKDVMGSVKEAISNWRQMYGPLLVGSHSDSKNRVYKAILNRLGFGHQEVEVSDPRTGSPMKVLIIQ